MRASRLSLATVAIAMLAAHTARAGDDDLYAKPKKSGPPPLVGLEQLARVAPDSGLIDVAIAGDAKGRLAYVIADAATRAEVHVMDAATGTEQKMIDIAAYTLQPSAVYLVGESILVVGPSADSGDETSLHAWLLGGKKPVKYGPGDAIVLATRKGKQFVAVRTSKETKKGTVYTFTRYDLKKGKKQGKARTWTLAGGRDEKLGFTFHHWTADGMVAVGMKDGEYDKKEDARMPDREAQFDLIDPSVKKPATTEIADLSDHVRRWQTLETEGGKTVFARVSDDLKGVELWRDDHPTKLTLDQPWNLYDPKSMTWAVGDDGTVWIGLNIDPWNQPAVDRKKQDPEYFDLFRVTDGTATRVGRVLAPKAHFAIGASAGHLWTLERNVGFDRGGKALTVYNVSAT
jgi:hypothetical protein